MNFFKNMFEKLGDAELVVEFQQFCGLKWNDHIHSETSEGSKHSNCTDAVRNSSSIHAENDVKTGVQYDYTYNPFVHLLFRASSALGDEQVLIALLSFMYWNVDPRAIMRVYLCLAVTLYLGQAAKDIIKSPRPPSPPVIRAEKKYADEYSTPSTHTMLGMVVPFSLVYFTHEKFQYNIVLALIAATLCCCLVGASRIYLGMHSVKDVLCGIMFESALIAVKFPCMKELALEKWCQTSSNVFSTAVILSITLLLFYPTSTPLTFNTYSDSVMVLGIITGSLLGLKFSASNENLMSEFLAKTQGMSLFQLATLYMLRFIVGSALLALTQIIMKWCITTSLSRMLPNVMILKPLGYKRFVEIPHKFITYGMVAFNCIYWVPKVFKLLGV